MKQKYDPNLRGAMDDIRTILKRRNIAGHILLASPTHTEYGLLYDIPTWSVVSFETAPDGYAIRIKAKKSNPGDDEKLAATTHMLCNFQDMMANGFEAMDTVIAMIRKHMRVLHVSIRGTDPDSVPGDD